MFVVTDVDAEVRVPIHESFEWKWDAEDFINDSSFPDLVLFEQMYWVSSEYKRFEYGPYVDQETAENMVAEFSQKRPMINYHLHIELVRISGW